MSRKFYKKYLKLLYNQNMMSIEEQKVIGEKIRQARAIAKLSQKDLAKIIGIGRVAVLNIESGEREVTVSELKIIAEATNQPFSFFYEEEKPKTESTPERYLDVTGMQDDDIEILEQMANCLKEKYDRKKEA
jgi:transcriptional regulator with XRE-family HTH domain